MYIQYGEVTEIVCNYYVINIVAVKSVFEFSRLKGVMSMVVNRLSTGTGDLQQLCPVRKKSLRLLNEPKASAASNKASLN